MTTMKKSTLYILVLIAGYYFAAGQSRGPLLQEIMDKYAAMGIPGVAAAVVDPDGPWEGASGFARIEDLTPMTPANLQYSQSVSKSYMAVAILMLYEEGKVDLDEKITAYLPKEVSDKVTGAGKMTVRMLLNHTSGAAEYNMVPRYIAYLVQHPEHVFTTTDYLNYIAGAPIQFEAGSKYRYTNMNYELLALIGDQLTGDHARYIREKIFVPLGLTRSFYRDDADYLDRPGAVNSYWDRYSNGVLENCTEMQKINVASMIGDDGMVATPMDYALFLKGLFEGKLLRQSTMDQMLAIVERNPGTENSYGYGLGLHRDHHNGLVEYGHTGGGIGAGCYLGYFPDRNRYFFFAINLGTSIAGPIHEQVGNMLGEMLEVLSR